MGRVDLRWGFEHRQEGMNARDHWETVYRSTAPEAVSWYQAHLEISLDLIRRAATGLSSSIIDVGGGESTLVDDLIAHGFQNVAVLDISPTALDLTRKRIGSTADRISWIAADVTSMSLPRHSIDIWHDRATFHFLISAEQRAAYVRNLLHCIRPGGNVIIGAFGPEGPERCSGLPVVRYDSEGLQRELGPCFLLMENKEEVHLTPAGSAQQFIYCRFGLEPMRVLRKG